MMRMWMLGSGSRGNAVVLEAAGTRILVDIGFTPQVTIDRLAVADIAPESIGAVIVTHEHVDHVRGVRVLSEKFGWTPYASAGTIMAARELRDAGAIPFRAGDALAIGEIDIATVRSSHDAAEPVVLVATARRSGARAGIAYDLGVATQSVLDAMRDLDLLVLEANHDEDMLRHGPYPPSVRNRIAGRNGHLSNAAAAQLARDVAHRDLRHVVLAHLSESCNSPRAALESVSSGMPRARFTGRVSVASQDRVVGPFEPGKRTALAKQLELWG